MLTIQLTCLIMYVSSSISTALSSNKDFLFATTIAKGQHIESDFGLYVTQTQDSENILDDTKIKLKEDLQIVSFSSLANVLLKSFPILLQGFKSTKM